MGDTSLRVRGPSEIVDAAFALYRRNALQYVMVTAIAYSPYIFFGIYVAGAPAPATPADIVKYLPGLVISILSFSLVGAVNSRMGADVYLGREADVGRTVREVVPRFPAVLLTMFVTALMTGISALFLLLPAIWISAITFAAIPIVVLERKGAFAAIGRSYRLSKGIKGHILGTLLLVWAVYLVMSGGISLIAGLAQSAVLSIMVSSVYAIFAYPIVNLAVMVLYYDARIRAEGFDVEHMAQSVPVETDTGLVGNSAF